jgi:hypothetical protein
MQKTGNKEQAMQAMLNIYPADNVVVDTMKKFMRYQVRLLVGGNTM